MKSLLESFPADVRKFVKPVLTPATRGEAGAVEIALAEMSATILERIEKGKLSPQKADDYFSYLDMFLDEKTDVDLSDDAKALIMEGLHLHDWGTPFAPDLPAMRELVGRILRR
jgi:hypothetical protein